MAGQAWNRGMEPNRVVLEHIRALLLALAVLVERAAGLPTVERLRFLAVLASGEAKARRLIVAMASGRCPGAPIEAAGRAVAYEDFSHPTRLVEPVLGLAKGQTRGEAPSPSRGGRGAEFSALLPLDGGGGPKGRRGWEPDYAIVWSGAGAAQGRRNSWPG